MRHSLPILPSYICTTRLTTFLIFNIRYTIYPESWESSLCLFLFRKLVTFLKLKPRIIWYFISVYKKKSIITTSNVILSNCRKSSLTIFCRTKYYIYSKTFQETNLKSLWELLCHSYLTTGIQTHVSANENHYQDTVLIMVFISWRSLRSIMIFENFVPRPVART